MHINIPCFYALEVEYTFENVPAENSIPRGFPAIFWLCGEAPQPVFLALFWGHCQATNLGFPVRLPSVVGSDS